MTIVINETEYRRLFESPVGEVARMLTKRAVVVEAEAQRSIHAHGRGRTYHLTGPQRVHQASAPGDPPATDLGGLSASLGYQVAVDGIGLHARVGSNLDKASFLERGTSRMAPRPFLRPALLNTRGGSSS